MPPQILGSVQSTISDFITAAEKFTDDLTQLKLSSLGLALACCGIYQLLRSRASYNALRAAYPGERFPWRKIWGAYIAAYGLNGIVPAGSGSVVQLVLSKASIKRSTYSTVTSALCSVLVFDTVMCAGVLTYAFAFSHGIFPKPKDFQALNSFDIAYLGRHPNLTIFLITALVVGGLATFAILSRRIAAFRVHLRLGWVILRDRRAYVLGMVVPQFSAWVMRGATYYFMLDAFHIGASVRNAILVLAVQIIAATIPFTPGGAGVQQALLVVIFSSTAPTDSVAVFAVGQQIALVLFSLLLGFAAITLIFRYHSFRELVQDARATKARERAPA